MGEQRIRPLVKPHVCFGVFLLAVKGLEPMKLEWAFLYSTLFLVHGPALAQRAESGAAKTVKQTQKVVAQTDSAKTCPFGDCELETKIQTACDKKPKGTTYAQCPRTVVIG